MLCSRLSLEKKTVPEKREGVFFDFLNGDFFDFLDGGVFLDPRAYAGHYFESHPSVSLETIDAELDTLEKARMAAMRKRKRLMRAWGLLELLIPNNILEAAVQAKGKQDREIAVCNWSMKFGWAVRKLAIRRRNKAAYTGRRPAIRLGAAQKKTQQD